LLIILHESKYHGYAGKRARTSAAMVAGPARFNAQQRGGQ